MKYMLLECFEREINTPAIFDTFEEAHDEMVNRIADIFHMTKEEIEEELRESDENDFSDWDINNNNAWINDYHHCNYDWKIYDVIVNNDTITCELHEY